jgi:hypothetical protein
MTTMMVWRETYLHCIITRILLLYCDAVFETKIVLTCFLADMSVWFHWPPCFWRGHKMADISACQNFVTQNFVYNPRSYASGIDSWKKCWLRRTYSRARVWRSSINSLYGTVVVVELIELVCKALFRSVYMSVCRGWIGAGSMCRSVPFCHFCTGVIFRCSIQSTT